MSYPHAVAREDYEVHKARCPEFCGASDPCDEGERLLWRVVREKRRAMRPIPEDFHGVPRSVATANQEAVLDFLFVNPRSSTRAVAEGIGVSYGKARQCLGGLYSKRRVERELRGLGMVWWIP